MKPLIIIRPEPGNSVSAMQACAMGLTVIAEPLFRTEKMPVLDVTPNDYDALFITSANALLALAEHARPLLHLPVFAVGPTSAATAQNLGFSSVLAGNSNGAALAAQAVNAGYHRLLHLTGDPYKPVSHPNLDIEVRLVYRMDPVPPSPNLLKALSQPAVLVLHSPRAARCVAALVTQRQMIDLVAISEQTARAAGSGWSTISVPSEPSASAMIDLAAPLCRTV